jgi:allophanate hydrolase subunit 2
MTFEILDPGLFTTIQDLGRPGFGAYGVPEGGALDRGAHRRANALVGNRPEAATLEFTLRGPRLRWGGRMPVRCAVVGDDDEVRDVKPGAVLDVGGLERSARGYVAAPGGFYARPLMGSASTFVVGGFGGLLGRALVARDRVDLVSARRRGEGRPAQTPIGRVAPGGERAADAGNPPRGEAPDRSGGDAADPPRDGRAGADRDAALPLRIIRGPAGSSTDANALAGAIWHVADGDRVGVRLRGPRLAVRPLDHSLPMCPGCIQVTASGQPILLLRDHPTVGGYPVLAVVIQADLDRAAQLRPGAEVRFEQVKEQEALRALRRNR